MRDAEIWDAASKRIAELEAENEQLGMELNSDGRFVLLKRERDEAQTQVEDMNAAWMEYTKDLDEARAEITRLKNAAVFNKESHENETGMLSRELLKAREGLVHFRAACAAKDEALRMLRNKETCAPESLIDAALSSTAGAKLWTRLEKAEQTSEHWKAEHEHRRGETLAARICEDQAQQRAFEMSAQLEAMRAALEEADGCIEHMTGCIGFDSRRRACHPELEPCDCGALKIQKQIDAALLPSAPRLYRNAVLEESAKEIESRVECVGNTYFAAKVRALKEEEGK